MSPITGCLRQPKMLTIPLSVKLSCLKSTWMPDEWWRKTSSTWSTAMPANEAAKESSKWSTSLAPIEKATLVPNVWAIYEQDTIRVKVKKLHSNTLALESSYLAVKSWSEHQVSLRLNWALLKLVITIMMFLVADRVCWLPMIKAWFLLRWGRKIC